MCRGEAFPASGASTGPQATRFVEASVCQRLGTPEAKVHAQAFFFFVSLYSILGRRHASRSVPERRLWWSLLVVDDWIRRSFLPSGLAYACFTGETSSALYLFNSHLEFIYLICFMFYTVYIVLHCFICVTPVCVTLFFFLFCFYLALFFFVSIIQYNSYTL